MIQGDTQNSKSHRSESPGDAKDLGPQSPRERDPAGREAEDLVAAGPSDAATEPVDPAQRSLPKGQGASSGTGPWSHP